MGQRMDLWVVPILRIVLCVVFLDQHVISFELISNRQMNWPSSGQEIQLLHAGYLKLFLQYVHQTQHTCPHPCKHGCNA